MHKAAEDDVRGVKGERRTGVEGCFEPVNYGRYSKVVDEELEYLASIGVLRIAGGAIGIAGQAGASQRGCRKRSARTLPPCSPT